MNCKDLRAVGGFWEDSLGDPNNCKFPVAPINTFTNLAYVLAGLVTWAHFQNWASAVFAITMLLLGLGSGYFHGTKTRFSYKFDDNGMYVVFSALLVYALNPHAPLVALIMAVVAALVVWFIGFGKQEAELIHPFVGILTAVIVLKLILSGAALYGLVSFAVFGIAYAAYRDDKRRTFPWKRWGHGVWHLLTALAITLLFWGAR